MFVQRWYQGEAVDYGLADNGSPILCAPTGSGKTLIALWLANWYIKRNRPVVIMTPREEILKQFVDVAGQIVGYENVGVVKSGWPANPYRLLQICSWPTLRARAADAHRKGRDIEFIMPMADLCIVDECHLSVSAQMRELVMPYFEKQSKVIGISATPATKSGHGLGSVYSSIKHVTSVRQLVKEGFLCPMEYFAGTQVDLTGVDMRGGDYVAKQLGDKVLLVGDYVENWLRLASDRHTIVFTPDKASCEGVTERYLQAGVSALSLHSGKSPERREAIVASFKKRDAQVLVNVGIASYGFDCPSVDCLQLLRNTKSLVLHLQQLGRGMRAMDGKTECKVLDHTRNVYDLGYGDDLFRYRLQSGNGSIHNWSRDPDSGETKKGEDPEPYECLNCHHLFSRRLDCPNCGLERIIAKRDLSTTDANLVRISRRLTADKKPEIVLPHGRELFTQLLHIQERRNYKPTWARNMFRKLDPTKSWPPGAWNNDESVPPCPELLNKVNKSISQFHIIRRKMRERASARG